MDLTSTAEQLQCDPWRRAAAAARPPCPAIPVALALALALAPAAFANDGKKYETSFRDAKFDNKFLVPTSQGHASLSRPDKDGVHLASSPGQLVNNLGFAPRFKLHGNFQVTAGFTIVRAPQPADGFGAGAVLQINTKDQGSAVIGRLCRKDGKQVVSTFAASGSGDQRQTAARMFPMEANQYRFRVSRTEKTLTFSIAEPPSDAFRVLSSAPFSDDDVIVLRCGLQQSHADASVEVVWHDLQIEADELVGLPDTLAAGEKQHRPQLQYQRDAPFPWGWASSTFILAGLFLAYWWRQRSIHG